MSLVALMNIQANVEFAPDHLFPGSNYAMLPLLSIYRNGNWTEAQVNENLGNIKIGLKLSVIFFWVGLVLGILLVLLAAWVYWFRLRRPKQEVQEADGTTYLKL